MIDSDSREQEPIVLLSLWRRELVVVMRSVTADYASRGDMIEFGLECRGRAAGESELELQGGGDL